MKDPKTTLRYLGFRPLPSGARRLEFSFAGAESALHQITVEAPKDLFSGPERMALQECAAICYETLKYRVIGCFITVPTFVSLTQADVTMHRKQVKNAGRPGTNIAEYR